MFKIGKIEIKGDIFLSPMAGISDSPYRSLCRAMGSGFSFTEFVSAEGLSRGSLKSMAMLRFEKIERPIIMQLFGAVEDSLVRAARAVQTLEPDVVDLNMGCSVNKVALKGAGAGLLRDPMKAGRIISAMIRELDVPVTAKIRLGWDEHTRNYIDTAHILEDAGVSMISVHGRTRSQAYRGEADWDAIGEIKLATHVPILGNGDVVGYEQAMARKVDYGVDGILVGRAAIGNPWIFSHIEKNKLSPDAIIDTALGHLRAMNEFYEKGNVLFRKHAARYFSGFPGAKHLRDRMMKCDSFSEAEDLCLSYKSDFEFPENHSFLQAEVYA